MPSRSPTANSQSDLGMVGLSSSLLQLVVFCFHFIVKWSLWAAWWFKHHHRFLHLCWIIYYSST